MFQCVSSNCDKVLPESLAAENRVGRTMTVLLLTLFFLLLFGFWIEGRELFRQEGLFATCAAELHWGGRITAHGIVQDEVLPLYPALVALLRHTGISMESSLRLISVVMLGLWSLLAGIAAARRRNFRAGVAAFCCCCGTVVAMGKGVDGSPAALTAFLVLAAQLLFFRYGSRMASWNKAWISAALLGILAFLSGGPLTLLYLLLPVLFLRRPLSVSSKFNAPGFFIASFLMILTIILWAFPAGFDMRREIVPLTLSGSEYLKQLAGFPLLFIIRLLPWSLICWMPFCAALQTIDPTPVFSKYLRTLFFTSFGLMWLLPARPAEELFLVIGPLAIMTGINYEFGVRRYGKLLRNLLVAGEIVIFTAAAVMAALTFLPETWVDLQPFVNVEKMIFRSNTAYVPLVLGAVITLAAIGVIFHFQRRRAPLWLLILAVAGTFGIFYTTLMRPGYMEEKRWRNLGRDIASAIPQGENVKMLYKMDIGGMYCGLFYSGLPVHKIRDLDELPRNETVYIISSGFPRHFGWRWTPLLPPDYKFEGEHLAMWRGVPVPPESEAEEESL